MFLNLEDYKNSEDLSKKCAFYITIEEYSSSQNYESAVDYIQNNKDILKNEDEYKTVSDTYRYLLAKQQFDNRKYVAAYNNLIDNSYTDAVSLLETIEPFYNSEKTVDEVLSEYQWMSDYIDSHNEKMGTNWSLFIDWDIFYLNIGASLTSLEKDIETKSLEECSYDIKSLIGYVPETKEEVTTILSDLREVFITKGGFADYNGYFLYYVMNFLTNDSEYIEITRDDSIGTITIHQVDKYLKEKNISVKTFAYMLGIPSLYAMDIEKEYDSLKLSFSPFSHNYSYCCIGNDEEKNDEIVAFVNKAFDNATYLYTTDGYDYFKINLNGINKFDLDYLRLTFVATKTMDASQILSQDHHLLEKSELSKNKVSVTVKLNKKWEYYCYYYIADYSDSE